jgi:hypothetical protein
MQMCSFLETLSTLVLLNHNDSNLSCQPHSNAIIGSNEQCNNFFDLCTHGVKTKLIMQHHGGTTNFGDGLKIYKAHVMNNENCKTKDKNGGETKE